MKNIKIKLAVCLLLMFCFAVPMASAETLENEMASLTDVVMEETSGPIVESEEIEELRTKNSKTYLLPDGSYQFVSYADAIHYEATDGTMKEIDNEVIEGAFLQVDGKIVDATDKAAAFDLHNSDELYKYTNADNEWRVYFKESLKKESAILIEKENASIAIQLYVEEADAEETLERAEATIKATVENTAVKATQLEDDLVYYDALRNDKRIVVYKDVAEEVDVFYAINSTAVKENILIKNQNHGEVAFLITGTGVVPEIQEGSLLFKDVDGVTVFELGKLFAYDANGKYTENIAYDIASVRDGVICTLVVDETFMKAADTVYPVVIDPTIMITGSSDTYDTCVDEQYPNSNYYLAESLWTGGMAGTNRMRTFMKFSLPENISHSQIISATLRIKKREHKEPSIQAYRITRDWSSNAVTWNEQPTFDSEAATSVMTLDSGVWYKLDMTTLVKQWLMGTYSNHGVVLKEPLENNSAQKTRFYSSDAPSPNKPELVINYTGSNIYFGSRAYQAASGGSANCMGYAVEYKEFIDLSLVRSEMVGKTTAELLTYINAKAQIWLMDNIGTTNYGSISSYGTTIPQGYFRVILRVGFTDLDGDGVYDRDETCDFHWWYQINENDGQWAQKQGSLSSERVAGSSGTDPTSLSSKWRIVTDTGLLSYNSAGKYYQIKDVRTVSW